MPIPESAKARLQYVIDWAWEIFVQKVVSERIRINKETSMQLHFSAVLLGLGELLCTRPGEIFGVELEQRYHGKNIDVMCSYGDAKAAIELKCFRAGSNRGRDIDMYDVLKDVERLFSYSDFEVRTFICLTDDRYYSASAHGGYAASVSTAQGMKYQRGVAIVPSWAGKWKNASRDKAICFDADICFAWKQRGDWYYCKLDLAPPDKLKEK